ncbi:MAG: TPM domain-containing protein [Azoarcus sp.]|nr:TPM domain-containing protein [Azoarcus sp.]
MNTTHRLLRHLWLDETDSLRTVGDAGLKRLEHLIGSSEGTHTGEICLCIEASLPLGMLWRHLARRVPIDDLVHERALERFSAMRVWDTEHNNGVLIYLQLAEHRIEIVADRGLAGQVEPGHWKAALAQSCADFRSGKYEAGLIRAIDAVTAELVTHFPAADDAIGADSGQSNQLPNRPVLR